MSQPMITECKTFLYTVLYSVIIGPIPPQAGLVWPMWNWGYQEVWWRGECKPRDKIFKTHKPRGHVVDVVESVLFWARRVASRDRYVQVHTIIALKIG